MKKFTLLFILFFPVLIAYSQKYVGPRDLVPGTFTDERDHKTYRSITIGGKVWMAENLNYAVGIGSWCYSLNVLNKMTGKPSEGCDEYGRLYTWETAQKVCPDGWHLPSDEEWNALIQAFGGEPVVKQKTKVDKYLDFNAQLGGFRNGFGVFRGIDATGFYWSSSESEDGGSYRRFDKEAFVLWYHAGKDYGFSVRCVKDY
jgi:uncharacterized protein (TIGR02145 family)